MALVSWLHGPPHPARPVHHRRRASTPAAVAAGAACRGQEPRHDRHLHPRPSDLPDLVRQDGGAAPGQGHDDHLDERHAGGRRGTRQRPHPPARRPPLRRLADRHRTPAGRPVRRGQGTPADPEARHAADRRRPARPDRHLRHSHPSRRRAAPSPPRRGDHPADVRDRHPHRRDPSPSKSTTSTSTGGGSPSAAAKEAAGASSPSAPPPAPRSARTCPFEHTTDAATPRSCGCGRPRRTRRWLATRARRQLVPGVRECDGVALPCRRPGDEVPAGDGDRPGQRC